MGIYCTPTYQGTALLAPGIAMMRKIQLQLIACGCQWRLKSQPNLTLGVTWQNATHPKLQLVLNYNFIRLFSTTMSHFLSGYSQEDYYNHEDHIINPSGIEDIEDFEDIDYFQIECNRGVVHCLRLMCIHCWIDSSPSPAPRHHFAQRGYFRGYIDDGGQATQIYEQPRPQQHIASNQYSSSSQNNGYYSSPIESYESDMVFRNQNSGKESRVRIYALLIY